MVKKVQLPVVGGIRKTIIIPDASLATTLAGFAGQTLTVAQLRTLLGVSAPTNTGNGNIGPPGQGAAPKTAPQIMQFIFGDGGGGDDSPGPPGQAGPPGAAGVAGPPGATGPLGTTLVYVNTTVPGGNTVSNTTSETFFTSAYAIPAGTLAAGMVVRVRLFGIYSTGIVAPSLALKVYFGSTVMIASGTLTTISNLTNDGWSAEGLFVVQTIGSSGTVEAQGVSEFSTAATTALVVNMDNTAAVTVNTTISQTVQASVQWGGTVNASDTITLREMTVEVISVAGIPVLPLPAIPIFFGEDGEDGAMGPPGAPGANGTNGGGSTPLPGITPNLVYWFRGDLVVGDFLPQLPNSGYLPAFAPVALGAGAAGAASTLNSLNVVNFPGSSAGNYNFAAPNITLHNSTVFVVFNPTVAAAGVDFISGGSGAYEFGLNASGKLELTKALIAVVGDSATTLSSGVWIQANVTYNDTTGAWAIRLAQAADASGTNIQGITAPLTTFAYNPFSGGVFFLNGLLAELIVYNRILSPTEITNIEAYLHTKWGI